MSSEAKQVSGTGYLFTYVGLVVLATVSLLLSRLHLGDGSVAIAIGIAFVKAFLVLWFFMGLTEQRFSNRFVVLVAVLLFALLVSLAATDVATRHTFPERPSPGPLDTTYDR